ncbi:MAG: hypothetical protein R3C58_10440 [Parvularculaceae bacterium]
MKWTFPALFALAACASAPAPAPTISAADFAPLIGRDMEGGLTYLDYGSKKRVLIPATLTILDAGPGALRFTIGYPDEPQHDGEELIEISADGRRFGEEEVLSRTATADGVDFVTRTYGPDDDVDAEFRFTYRITRCAYSAAKEVRPLSEEDFFERNIYEFSAPGCA